MTDVVDIATRSRMMSGIKSKNTKPEILIRKGLHARGVRYRLHVGGLPGKPDLVLAKYKAVIFVHGCFWHGHDCRFFKVPLTRPDFWLEKIGKNKFRDQTQISRLVECGWRVLVVWECATRTANKGSTSALIDLIENWLRSGPDSASLDEKDIAKQNLTDD